MKEYALYVGDEMLCMGTIEEIAKRMGVKPDTVRYYGYPAYTRKVLNEENRRILVEIEMGYDE